MKTLEYDLLAIGGGTAGLVSASGASYLGLRAGLVEREALGGDCLWTGCVPSKALIASTRLAHAMNRAGDLGLQSASPTHTFSRVMARMREARDRVAHHDDPERFRAMGVGVHFGSARFTGPGEVEVEGVGRIRSRRIVLATGAGPATPPIPGLDEAGFLNHTNVFQQDSLPESVTILGGGPIGLEFSQVFHRLGARVTVVEMLPHLLPREDRDVSVRLQEILEEEGIAFRLGSRAASVRVEGEEKVMTLEGGEELRSQEIFVAAGRRPQTRGLEPDRAGVEMEGQGIRVDRTLRTSARGVWAAGDVTGGLQFTHVADFMARTALQNSVFPFKKRVDYRGIPRVTYTDPEVAQVGMSLEEAEGAGGRAYTYPFQELDRAIVDGDTQGFVRILATRKGRILGATILGRGAGELLMPISLAMKAGLTLPKISGTVFPYPTRIEGVKRAADAFQRARLEGTGGKLLRKVVSWLR